MRKAETSAQALDAKEQPPSAVRAPASGALDATNPPFICAVLFLNIVEYSKKPVSEQLKAKEQFHRSISSAIEHSRPTPASSWTPAMALRSISCPILKRRC